MRATTQWSLQLLEPVVVMGAGLLVLMAEWLTPLTMLLGLSLLLLPFLLRLFMLGQITTPSLVNVPLLLLLVLLASSSWVTPFWQNTWPQLVRMLWGVAVCLTVINWINPVPTSSEDRFNTRRHLSPRLIVATLVFFAIGVIATTIGLLAMEPTAKIEQLDALLSMLPKLYMYGVGHFNSNNVAGIIVLFVPLALAFTIGPVQLRQRSVVLWLAVKVPIALLTFYFGAALLLTQTRGAWLAAACASFFILIMLGRRGWLVLALVVVVTAGALSAVGPTNVLDRLTVRDDSSPYTGSLIQDRNLAARMMLWQRAIHGIADAPLTGMGLGAFDIVSNNPYPQVDGYIPDPDIQHAHNIVLQIGLDFGVPGIIALITIFMIAGRMLVLLIHQSETPSLLRTWSLGLMGSLVAYLVHNMLNAITLGSPPAVIVWFLFGMCIGAGEWMRRQPIESNRDDDRPIVVSLPSPTGFEGEMSEWERRAWAATAGSDKR